MIAIDSSRISAMMEQLKSSLQQTQTDLGAGRTAFMPGLQEGGGLKLGPTDEAAKTSFGNVLADHLNQISGAQSSARALGERFALGDDTVALSDVMIASQKASLAFQATVQVRNRFVSAYQEMMSMPV